MAKAVKTKKLTDEQMAIASSYAKKRWPKDEVTVQNSLNKSGEVVFRRVRVSTRELSELLELPKRKKPKSLA